MKKIIVFILFIFISNSTLFAQKIDTDSLLVKTFFELNVNKNYTKAIELAHLGIKEAPDYLDFYVVLGQSYGITKEIDSAYYYLNLVIDRNPKYKSAFIYLAKLQIEENKIADAIATIDKALLFYPDEKTFYLLKLQAINLNNEEQKTISYLNYLSKKYPADADLQQQLIDLKYRSVSDRAGINYSFTSFDRSGVGPWHLLGVQYIRERKKLTLIAQINYADRRSFGNSINSGIQYQFDTYFKNSKKSYSFTSISYSNDIVFPKLRLSYSYFSALGKAWEGDVGLRYTRAANADLYTAVLGVGKYIGSYWFNLQSFLQTNKNNINPAFTATTRYYFDTKYDYASVIAGFGTSPDERIYFGQYQERVSLSSYRIGVGYNKLLGQHFCTGIQVMLNHQEYVANKFQNETDIFLLMQYKF
jgi:YaiO family outer membrane protein